MKKLDIKIGSKFGNYTIIKEVKKVDKTKRRFLCKCICGNTKEQNLIHLTTGVVVSCGCYIPSLNRGRLREKNRNWKGGRREEDGYILVYNPLHQKAKSNGYVREHVLVMENKLKRSLLPYENIHHLNGERGDNRIENLELWNTSHPPGQRIRDKIKWAKEILETYKNFEE